MLQICPRIPNKPFDELHFEEEILAFLRELVYGGEIKMITDEDFVYQVEHKDAKKSNEMYYPRFTKVIANFFMTKDQSIPRRNKVNWHFSRDDHMFTMIKLVSKHQNTQQYGAIFPVKLMNESIRNSESYKEYYAIALGAEPPMTKASVRKKQSSFDTIVPPLTAKGKRLKNSAKMDKPVKEKQSAKTSKAKGLTVLSEVALTEAEQFSTHDEEDKDEESFVPIVQTPSQVENTDDEDSHGMNVEGDEGSNEKDEANELYRDVNINLEGRDIQMVDVQKTQVIEDNHVTPVNPEGQQ
nr:hypothetical protein [Tanacetum cinerariifolium]